MPKLPTLTPQKIIKVLEKKGFTLDRIKGSHYIYYNNETKKRVLFLFIKGIYRKELYLTS